MFAVSSLFATVVGALDIRLALVLVWAVVVVDIVLIMAVFVPATDFVVVDAHENICLTPP